MMPTQTPTDEQLKDQAIRQALSGDTIGARETISGVVDRRYLRDAWQMLLFIESERGNVQAVKDTIVSCPDQTLLASHFYLELPQVFVKAGDRSGGHRDRQGNGRGWHSAAHRGCRPSRAGRGCCRGARSTFQS